MVKFKTIKVKFLLNKHINTDGAGSNVKKMQIFHLGFATSVAITQWHFFITIYGLRNDFLFH